MSRNWLESLTAAGGGHAAGTTQVGSPPSITGPGTATYTRRSTTGAVSPAQKSTTTKKRSPRPGSGGVPLPGTSPSVSTHNALSPTTAPATNPDSGTGRVQQPAPRSRRRDPAGPEPTAKSKDSTGSFSRNGPTFEHGPQRPNGPTPTQGSSTSTITPEPTERSDGPPPSASPGTTSPKSTDRRRVVRYAPKVPWCAQDRAVAVCSDWRIFVVVSAAAVPGSVFGGLAAGRVSWKMVSLPARR